MPTSTLFSILLFATVTPLLLPSAYTKAAEDSSLHLNLRSRPVDPKASTPAPAIIEKKIRLGREQDRHHRRRYVGRSLVQRPPHVA